MNKSILGFLIGAGIGSVLATLVTVQYVKEEIDNLDEYIDELEKELEEKEENGALCKESSDKSSDSNEEVSEEVSEEEIKPLIFGKYHFTEYDSSKKEPWVVYTLGDIKTLFYCNTEEDAKVLMDKLDSTFEFLMK